MQLNHSALLDVCFKCSKQRIEVVYLTLMVFNLVINFGELVLCLNLCQHKAGQVSAAEMCAVFSLWFTPSVYILVTGSLFEG